MTSRITRLFWRISFFVVVTGVVLVSLFFHPASGIIQAVKETRQSLRQQGFKTDLADFNFSTSDEIRTRAEALINSSRGLPSIEFRNRLDLMPVAGNDSAVVVWQEPAVRLGDTVLDWPHFHDQWDGSSSDLDAACEAVMSGQIRFELNASQGAAIILPHLTVLRNLCLGLDDRTLLELHDGHADAAWTNLFAATRLVSAWSPEPVLISQLVRETMAHEVFNATWQALQQNGWTDQQLAALQQQWTGVDWFTNLPEVVAFQRAMLVANCQANRKSSLTDSPNLPAFFHAAANSPLSALSEVHDDWTEMRYRTYGTYDDEKHLLLYYRDRELEYRAAIQAATWEKMRTLPGVTNSVPYQSPYPSRFQSTLPDLSSGRPFQRVGGGIMERSAILEIQRRLLITALALARYHLGHGSYPPDLASLSPKLLPAPLVDFVDGQPLRYRLTGDGHYVLYSVGLNDVDDGGKIALRGSGRGFGISLDASDGDIVWPRPATAAEIQTLHNAGGSTADIQSVIINP